MLPEHSVQPRGERQSGGLAYALNRVDILSLPWKVERTLETLGGSRKMRRRGRERSRKGWGDIYPVYSVQAITYTCSSLDRHSRVQVRDWAGRTGLGKKSS